MIKKIKQFITLTNEDILLIVLSLMSFSFGIWVNYRQLWLQNINYSVSEISRIISVSLVCSSIIIFIISFFSTKVKLKNIIFLSIIFRAISLIIVSIVNIPYVVKTCMLLCIMCENIFSVAFYPFLSSVNKSNKTYQKHVLINYFSKDIAVIFCGLLLGATIGKVVFSYSTCLFLTLIFTLLSGIFLLLFEEEKVISKKKSLPLKKAFKDLFASKKTNLFLLIQFVIEIAYALIFGMIMLILTSYINISVSFASIFIILFNLLGSLLGAYIIKKFKDISTKKSVVLKYGVRSLIYLTAVIINTNIAYLIAIAVGYITSRLFEDKVTGVYVRDIKTDNQFLFGNIRYFILCIGDGIGVFLAGMFIKYNLSFIFVASSVFTILGIIIHMHLDRIQKTKHSKSHTDNDPSIII